jgi:IS30 family transposase
VENIAAAQSLLPPTNAYFAHPYQSWKRGLKEKSKDLLRQYFPKSKGLVEAKVQWAVDRLDHGEAKRLDLEDARGILQNGNTRTKSSSLVVALHTRIRLIRLPTV